MRVAPMTSRFLDACRRRPTDVRPVWFMRQAGRYMRQYRQIREKHGILEICKRPDLAAAVTLQPVELLDVDAAIIFADLLLPVEPMGLKLTYPQKEGPKIHNPVLSNEDVDALSTSNTDDLGYVGEAIQQTVRALAGRACGRRLCALCPALFKGADRPDQVVRRARDPLRNRRFRLFQGTARRRWGRDGLRLAHQHRSGLGGYLLSLGHYGESGSRSA